MPASPTSSPAPSTPRRRRPTARSRSGRRPSSPPTDSRRRSSCTAATGGLVSRFALNLPEYTTPRHEAHELQLGSLRGSVCRSARPSATCSQRQPRHLRARASFAARIVVRAMLDYRDAAVHLVAEPVSRVAAARSARPRRKACRAATSSSSSTAGAARRSTRRARASGRCPTRCSSALVDVARAVLDDARPRRRTLPRVLPRRPRRHLRARVSGDHLVRPSRSTWPSSSCSPACSTPCSLAGATLFSAARLANAPASGRALLREVRSSFYRKLFLAFVAGAVVPVVILAFADAHLLRRRSSAPASKRPRPGPRRSRSGSSRTTRRCSSAAPARSTSIDDQIMVLVSRAIDQDVNLFDRSQPRRRRAQRDLFASRLLSPRTPGDVYRAHRARPAADLRRRRGASAARRYLVAAAPGPRRRPRRDRHRAADAAAAGDRAADRRARSPRAVRRGAVQPARRRRSATGWPSGSPIRSTG